ncbi:aldo/keto reductase [Pseudoduganella chitinolytica]
MTDMAIPMIEMNDGHRIPQLGLGVWQDNDEQAAAAVRCALQAGYRLIDTASIYENEVGVGEGVRQSGIDRADVFVTTKIWNDAQGYQAAQDALHASLERLQMDYVDLLLIHWPVPSRDLYVDTWRALIKLREQGLARSIGVSNFRANELQRLFKETHQLPAVNQIELHPWLQQAELRTANGAHGVRTQAWSPLGQGKVLADPLIAGLAAKHGCEPAQVVLRWHIQHGVLVIPKSSNPERIRANADIFDFTLDEDDMAALAGLDRGQRVGPDPDTFGA